MQNVEILPPDDFPLSAASQFTEAHRSLSQYFRKHTSPLYTPAWEADARQIIPPGQHARLSLLQASIERLVWLTEQAGLDEDSYRSWITGKLRNFPAMLQIVMSALGEAPLLHNADEAETLAQQVAILFAGDQSDARKNLPGYRLQTYQFPVESVVRQWEWLYKTERPTPAACRAFADISRALKSHALDRKNRSRLALRLDRLLGNDRLPEAGEAWADGVISAVYAMPAERQAVRSAVFSHAGTASGSKPSAKWVAEAAKNRLAVGEDDLTVRLVPWLEQAAPPPPFTEAAPRMPNTDNPTRDFYQSTEYQDYRRAHGLYYLRLQEYLGRISEKNITILKGLAWYAADIPSADLARALGRMTEQAFHSVRERGPWAKSAGNAAVWALGQMPNGVGVGPLARLRTKLRDRGALKLIASSIGTAAAKAGMSVDELEDLAVPTGGLDADGTRHETFGEGGTDGAATLTLDAKTAKTNLQWFGPDGKPRKAVPAAVKKSHAAEVKALKAAEDEIKQALGAQSARLDRALTDERTWTYGEWRERYLAHPILRNLARRLIWTVDGTPLLPNDLPLLLPPLSEGGGLGRGSSETVRLWHPLHAPDIATVGRWRDTLEAQGIVQPFKQAHREVYLLTDAERATRTYSNRFAAHVLKQHQFNSLAVLRGWKNQLRLMVDDSYPPATKLLPQHNLRAEFWVEGIGEDYGTDTNETGTYLRLTTDQVRFYPLDAPTHYAHAGGGGYAANMRNAPAEPIPLDQIPPLVLSEVLRDVDLFVGVASLGNDANWSDGGPQGRFRDYWRDYAFGDLGESAKTRADVLSRLLPRLKIAPRARLDGKFLVVRGDLRTYKIHLGSGNILMEPNDQYLCIVPKAGVEEAGGGLLLPFEGDRTLSVILSKAFLLADDTRIADPTITQQLRLR